MTIMLETITTGATVSINEINSKYQYPTKSTLVQVYVSLVANTGYFLFGLVMVFPSIILPPLLNADLLGEKVSLHESSWIASISFMSGLVGCLLGGPVVDLLGRRRGLYLLNIPFLCGWVLIALVPSQIPSVWPLLVGRLLTGFASGLSSSASVTYTAEVVTPPLRTALVALSPIMMGIGIFFGYLLSYIFQEEWTSATNFAILVTIVSCILTPLLPESPLWLLKRDKQDEAHNSLVTLRGATSREDVQDELMEMVANTELNKTNTNSGANTFKNLCRPEAYKPLMIMQTFFIFQQCTGVTIIITYGVQFAKDAEISDQAHIVAMSIGLVRVIANFLTLWSCNRWGRRKPAIVNSAGTCIFFLGLAAYTYLRHMYHEDFPSRPWIPAVLIVMVILTSSIVYSTLLTSMLGEVYPTSVRGICSGITSCIGYFYAFTMVKLYLHVQPLIGNTASFVFFGVSALIGTVFLAVFLPETHGKTLAEIENFFKSKKESKLEISNTP